MHDIYALFYGEFPDLARRTIQMLLSIPKGHRIWVWANVVCPETRQLLVPFQDKEHHYVLFSDENVPKYHVMKELFEGISTPTGEWTLWLDDDIRMTNMTWWDWAQVFIDQHPEAVCFGTKAMHCFSSGQRQFLETAEWYRGRPLEDVRVHRSMPQCLGARFVLGGYTWLRTDMIRLLKWPDPRLRHAGGGDIMLGAALYQAGHQVDDYTYGVDTRGAPRRGTDEALIGT